MVHYLNHVITTSVFTLTDRVHCVFCSSSQFFETYLGVMYIQKLFYIKNLMRKNAFYVCIYAVIAYIVIDL